MANQWRILGLLAANSWGCNCHFRPRGSLPWVSFISLSRCSSKQPIASHTSMRSVKAWYFDFWFGLEMLSSQRWTWRIWITFGLRRSECHRLYNISKREDPPLLFPGKYLSHQRHPHHCRLLIHIEANFHGFRRKVHVANFFTSFIANWWTVQSYSRVAECQMDSNGLFFSWKSNPQHHENHKRLSRKSTHRGHHPHDRASRGKPRKLHWVETFLGHYCTLQYVIHPHFIYLPFNPPMK